MGPASASLIGKCVVTADEMFLIRTRAVMLRFRCGLLFQVQDVFAVLVSAKWAKFNISGYTGNDA